MRSITLKISSQGQISLPKRLREALDLEKASELIVLPDLKKKRLILESKPKSWAEYGLGLGEGVWDDVGGPDAYLKKERDSWSKRYERRKD